MGFDESASAVEDLLELVVGIRLRRVFSAEVERALEKRGLDVIERPSDHVDGRLARNTLLRLRITAGHLECLVLNIARRSEEHTSELQSRGHLVCRLLLENK